MGRPPPTFSGTQVKNFKSVTYVNTLVSVLVQLSLIAFGDMYVNVLVAIY